MEDKHFNFKKINKYLLFLCFLAILIGVVFSTNAYSRFISRISGKNELEIANMICEIEVQQNEEDPSIVHPYCIVNVKNYDINNNLNMVDLKYKIEITPKDDFELPSLYWEDESGNIISYYTYINGKMGFTVKQTDTYKVVFNNSGERDITRLVDFNLVVVQAEQEKIE